MDSTILKAKQAHNRAVQKQYEAWLVEMGINPHDPLKRDAQHSISVFLNLKGLSFESVMDATDALRLELATGLQCRY